MYKILFRKMKEIKIKETKEGMKKEKEKIDKILKVRMNEIENERRYELINI